MSNIQSYNALIDRFKAFASGHFILKRFSHGQIEVSDLEKFGEYPFMHVVPSNVTYAKGMKTFSFQIVLADMPRDKEDKTEYQREVLSDLQRIAEDLVAEITNHRVLFGDLITVNNVSLEPFLEEFQHTLTGWTISLDLLVPYYWDACSIPAEWNDMFESSTGGTGSILTFVDSITRDENGNVSLVNDEAEPSPNYYYGTNDEGVRGWYLLTDEVGLTCVTLPSCQTIIDIEAAIDLLQTDVTDLQGDVSSLETNKVPYTGATGDVDLGEYELKAGQIEFDQTPTGTAGVGVMRWNDSDGTLDLGLKGGNVILQVGQESVLRVVNKTATNVNLLEANYQAVRVTGAQGQRLKVDLALATTDGLSAETIGLVTETINNNQEGFITTSGLVRGINTTGSLQGETWADGDILYLSPTTAGNATKVKPTAPNHLIVLGYVIHAHITQGSIFVKVDNGYELDELHNVYIDTPANNNVLTYESSTSLWKNKTVATALGYTPVPETRTLTINGTTQDLSANRTFTIATGLTVGTTPITSGTVGRVLFEGTGNVLQESANLFWDNTNGRLGVGTSSPTYGIDIVGAVGLPSSIRTGWGVYSRYLINPTATATYIEFTPSTHQIQFSTLGVEAMRIFSTRNIAIGTTTDAGFKLDVNGTARLNGLTAINGAGVANTALAVYGNGNGAGNYLFRMYDASAVERFFLTASGNFKMTSATDTGTTGDDEKFRLALAFAPTSGTRNHYGLYITQTINQTGTATGITRGLYINPTLTAAADFRAIETSNGKVIFGGTGNVLIGTTTDAGFKLDVNGTARLGGDTIIKGTGSTNATFALRVQNSAGTDLLTIKNANTAGDFNLNAPGGGKFGSVEIQGLQIGTGGGNTLSFPYNPISIGGTLAVASAQLQMDSTTRGFLPPRMTTTQKNAIASPAAGLVVYDTTLGKLCVRTASSWETITSI
jgi:hypothetical protein